jgi:hypothetical protein
MNMSFSEKSAWGLLIGLVIMSWWYFPRAFAIVDASDGPAALGAISVFCVIGLVIFEAVYHAVIAARGGEETDERDQLFNLKAERNAGFVLGIALFTLVGRILATSAVPELGAMTALVIAVWILFAITVSEISKVLWQIWYYRISS